MRVKAFFTVIGMIVAAYFFSVFLEEKVEAKYNTETAADAPEETRDSTPAG
ncbi:MAG: hypothetical protein V3R20_02300 [Sphingomonadales bacterium]